MNFNLNETMIRSLPNKLTLFRIIAAPIILIFYPLDIPIISVICALIFALASFTDYVDGYIARKYNAFSKLGQLLDPVADKVLVASGLLLLAATRAAPIWILGVILCRDIVISGLRLVAVENNFEIEVNKWGKGKTLAQMVAIFCLMINFKFVGLDFHAAGLYFLVVALALSVYSGYVYLADFWAFYKPRAEPL